MSFKGSESVRSEKAFEGFFDAHSRRAIPGEVCGRLVNP